MTGKHSLPALRFFTNFTPGKTASFCSRLSYFIALKLFEKVRSNIAIKRLIKAEKNRPGTPVLCRPVAAGSICLLSAPANEKQFLDLCSRTEQWQARGKEVTTIAWFDSRRIPVWAATSTPGMISLCRKNINLLFAPSDHLVSGIMKKPFQLLINVSPANCLPMLYIVTGSAATFRAGFSDGNLFFHDFTLMQGNQPAEDLNLENLIHHLNQLNP